MADNYAITLSVGSQDQTVIARAAEIIARISTGLLFEGIESTVTSVTFPDEEDDTI